MVQSGNRVVMDESTIYGPMKQMSDFKYDEAFKKAADLSRFLNSSIKSINVGPNAINCYEHTLDESIQYPIENYLDSDCAVSERKEFLINTIDESSIDSLTQSIVLRGDDLVYNVFYFSNPKLFEKRTIRLDVPDSSFVIINFENTDKTTHLNNHMIDFVNSSPLLSSKSVIFNFLHGNDIVFDFEQDFHGTVLAPHSNFYAVSKASDDLASRAIKMTLNSQIVANNIYLANVRQSCTIFEAFL